MRSPVHLNALRAFEASARHGSFSLAAAELNVTPAAVGQLVRTLEQWLGAPLFHRGSSGKARLQLTETAESALPDIRAGFDRLSMGVTRLREAGSNGVLTVTVSPAFAAKWLLPRIDRFQAQWPDIDIRLDTSLKLLDFAAQGIDIGVRYGGGAWPGVVADLLMTEEVYPVTSPALAATLNPAGPSDLTDATLIHDQSVDPGVGFMTWDTWFRSAGRRDAFSGRGLRINNSAAVLQAAIDGQGVALARSILAHDDIAAGRLVRLLPDITVPSILGYYVVHRAECASLPKLRAFKAWLREEVAL